MAFQNIVLFGVGGTNIGHHILQLLAKDTAFKVTVLARQSSKTSSYPSTVRVVKLDDSFPHNELVQTLRGQDVVICTGGPAAEATQYKLIDAAVEAGVKRFIPSEWGLDNADPANQELCPIFKGKSEIESYLRSKESNTFKWTAVATGIWLDWALGTNFVDVDPVGHAVQIWRNGDHMFSASTLPYCAQAVVRLFRHPEIAENQRVFLSPFEASQRQVVAELEKLQNVAYSNVDVDGSQVVRDAQAKWKGEKDMNAAFTLVKASILLPEYKAGFVSAGKHPVLEDLVGLPKLSVEDVVREWVEQH